MTVNQTLLFEGAIILACLYSFIVLLVVPLAHIAEKIRWRVVDKNYLGLERDEEIVIAAIRKLDDETIKRITGPAKKWKQFFHYIVVAIICFIMFSCGYFILGIILSLIPVFANTQLMKLKKSLTAIIPHISKFNITVSSD